MRSFLGTRAGGTASAVTAAASAVLSPADLDEVRCRVRTAQSSFYWAMRLVPRLQRAALFAIYAFCREVDDIADGGMNREDKVAALASWRRTIDALYGGQATDAVGRVLAASTRTFALRREDFLAVIQGMEMDAHGPIVGPTHAELDLYCDRVAGAVGRLCVQVFGQTRNGLPVAGALGRALQLTNILRDVEEDAQRGRLYLPREILAAEGLAELPAATVVKDPRLPHAMAALGAIAEQAFAEADNALAICDRKKMRPAVVMAMLYRGHLGRMRANGWWPLPRRGTLARTRAGLEKLWITLQYGLM